MCVRGREVRKKSSLKFELGKLCFVETCACWTCWGSWTRAFVVDLLLLLCAVASAGFCLPHLLFSSSVFLQQLGFHMPLVSFISPQKHKSHAHFLVPWSSPGNSKGLGLIRLLLSPITWLSGLVMRCTQILHFKYYFRHNTDIINTCPSVLVCRLLLLSCTKRQRHGGQFGSVVTSFESRHSRLISFPKTSSSSNINQ